MMSPTSWAHPEPLGYQEGESGVWTGDPIACPEGYLGVLDAMNAIVNGVNFYLTCTRLWFDCESSVSCHDYLWPSAVTVLRWT